MDDRSGTAHRERTVADGDGAAGGYPLREEAADALTPPPLEPVDQEVYATPVAPGARVARRRRRFVPTSPWPGVLAALLLLAGLGVVYAVTRASSTARPGGSPAAAAPAPSAPQQGAPSAPQQAARSAAKQAAPSRPTTSAPAAPPPAAPARPVTVAVPSVIGASLARALAALSEAKLTADVVHVDSSKPSGRVLAQHPAVGSKVAQDAHVRLSVSVEQLVTVPNVVGRQGLDAVHELQSDHLVASLRYVPSTQLARRVVSQYPAGGQKVRRGTSVRLNLSQGLRKR
jgi:PASTA domain